MRHEKLPPNPNVKIDYSQADLHRIYLAGGCFWGTEAYLQRLPGVAATNVGYANGRTENPSYQDVCYSNTGHAETVEVRYDPERIDLETLLQYFFEIIDPTLFNQQGNDRGTQYRTGIYYVDPTDLPVIQAVVSQQQLAFKLPIVTEIRPLEQYFPAEDYHQDYLEKNPGGYCHVSFATLPGDTLIPVIQSPAQPAVLAQPGVAPVIDPSLYSRPDDTVLKKKLTPLSYAVVRKNATEHPFSGAYWREERTGLYVDVVTGEPLFSSRDKFDAGCGWPSFTKPVDHQVIVEKRDRSHGMDRVEVRSRTGDSHLGHVFTDGPASKGGLRYCINSASLRFIPLSDLEREGYGDWLMYFRTPEEQA